MQSDSAIYFRPPSTPLVLHRFNILFIKAVAVRLVKWNITIVYSNTKTEGLHKILNIISETIMPIWILNKNNLLKIYKIEIICLVK